MGLEIMKQNSSLHRLFSGLEAKKQAQSVLVRKELFILRATHKKSSKIMVW